MQVSSVVAICGLFYGKYYLNCHLSSFNFSPEGWCFFVGGEMEIHMCCLCFSAGSRLFNSVT